MGTPVFGGDDFMYRNPTAVALRELLARVQASGTENDVLHRERLQGQVWAVVDDLRAMGWPPERVLISVKQIAADAGLRPSPMFSRASQPLANEDALLARIVRWTIDRYYRGTDS